MQANVAKRVRAPSTRQAMLERRADEIAKFDIFVHLIRASVKHFNTCK